MPPSAAGAINEVLHSGRIAGDDNVQEFENELRDFIGGNYLAATGEFSRSIEMALRMAGVGPGDSVAVSPLACLATTMPILQVGARPIWCDVESDTGALNPADVSRRVSEDTKAILLYHWVENPGEIDGILQTAARLNLKVIEDAGEAFAAQ